MQYFVDWLSNTDKYTSAEIPVQNSSWKINFISYYFLFIRRSCHGKCGHSLLYRKSLCGRISSRWDRSLQARRKIAKSKVLYW